VNRLYMLSDTPERSRVRLDLSVCGLKAWVVNGGAIGNQMAE